MNIFHKVALEGLKKNRTRTLVTIIGVVLSAAMITAVAGFGTSLLKFLINSSIAASGNWHVALMDVDSSFAQERSGDRDAANTASFETIGWAVLDGGKSPEKPYLFIAGFNEKTYDTLPIHLITGRLPDNQNEILVPSHVGIKGGVSFRVGDTLPLMVGNRHIGDDTLSQHDPYLPGTETLVNISEKHYTVVGTYERPGFEEHSAPGYTLITNAGTADPSNPLCLFVSLKNPHQVHAYADRVSGGYDYVFNDDVLRFFGVSDNQLFNTILFSVGGILVAIIMTGSIFLIYNSFNISLNERTHEFGILLSIGATAKQLRNSVLFEGLCIGIIGIPVGIGAGIGCIGILIPVIASNIGTSFSSSVPLTLSLSVPAIAAAAAVSLVTIMISAYIPSKKAAKMPVMECIRQSSEITIESSAVKTSKTAQRIYGLEGTLALKNFKRDKKRYRSIVLSLTLSVVLFVSGNTFGTTLKRLAKEYIVEIDGDISFYTEDMKENQLLWLYEKLKNADGVYQSTFQADLTYSCTTSDLPDDFLSLYRESAGDKSTGNLQELPLDVQFIEDNIYYDFIESLSLPTEEYTGQDAAFLIAGVNTVRHTTYFTDRSMDFTIPSADGKESLTIRAAFVDSYPLDTLPRDSSNPLPEYYFMVIAPWSMKPLFDTLGGAETFGLTFWSETPAQSLTQIQSLIENAAITASYTLINLSASVELFRSLTFVVDLFTSMFVGMISLIAIANVFNTISTNIRLRRRELAMLRSVGMSDRAFHRMMNFECIFYGMKTLMFGVPIAGIISWLIYEGIIMAERIDDFNFVFPWGSILISVLGVFIIVFITMLYATSRIKKENIIEALRDDMT